MFIFSFVIILLSFSNKSINTSLPANDTNGLIIDTLAKNLNVPWSFAFTDDTTLLFTERNGKVRLMRNYSLIEKPVIDLKDVELNSKMGLLSICIHPDFKMNNQVYLAYNYKKDGQDLLRIVRYVFSKDSLWQPLIIVEGIYANRNHTGCRLLFDKEKKLYISTGDADMPRLAQDLKSLNGKILRVNDDGSIPADNPFVNNDTARKQIWTYGHRNSQGIAFQPETGKLYSSEHGPVGGDEINQIVKDKNYGWPIVHHKEIKEGFVSPIMEFTPSIGPSELIFYNKDLFPELKGNLLIANLRNESIMRFNVNNDKVVRLDNLLTNTYGRLRVLTVAPDGSLIVSTSENDPPEGRFKPGYDLILRIRPNKGKSIVKTNKVVPKKNTIKKTATTHTSAGRIVYMNFCASCHGADLKGTKAAQSLKDNKWLYGSSRNDIIRSTKKGIVSKGMPAWEGALTEQQIVNVVNYIIQSNKK